MTTSVYSTNNNNNLRNANYDIISKALIYKKLNPPHCRIYKFNSSSSYLGTFLSKGIILIFNVQGIGKIVQRIVYDIKNNIVKYSHFYVSEKEMKQNRKQCRKKKLGKTRYVEHK